MTASRLRTVVCLIAAFALASVGRAKEPDPPFYAHEWGTFTALQDDKGDELPGINIDDEPVPGFVHNLTPYLLNNPILSQDHWIYRQKGAPRQHPMVTLRLETPVIYFHPGKNGGIPDTVDVRVLFRGGWLTEFYPYAKAELPGLRAGNFDFGPLLRNQQGSLEWRDVKLNTAMPGPKTDEHVWLAPRKVDAVDVSVTNPGRGEIGPALEHERYLFYRGVANQQAPLRVVTDRAKNELTIRANFQDALCKAEVDCKSAWLVEIRPDGKSAYRALPAMRINSDPERIIGTTPRSFSEGDFDSQSIVRLKEEMHSAIRGEGLNADEATAMLATWNRAYFQTAGLRLFFLVPARWTEHYLPLHVSGEPEIKRAMMGRIELITDRQQALLKKVSAGVANIKWMAEIAEGPAKDKFLAGRSDFGDLGVKIPEDYLAYLALGRFRNALIIAQAKANPSAGLTRFISNYDIHPYEWAK
jgi:hypothetical protein